MFIHVMKSKLHRVKITQAELNYVGSVTIDEDLMDAANLIENEKVQIVNNNNGERFETYVIKGERGSGTVCLAGRCRTTVVSATRNRPVPCRVVRTAGRPWASSTSSNAQLNPATTAVNAVSWPRHWTRRLWSARTRNWCPRACHCR